MIYPLNNIGFNYFRQNELNKSKSYFFQTLEYCDKLNKYFPNVYNVFIAKVYTSLGDIHTKENQDSISQRFYIKSLEILERNQTKNKEYSKMQLAIHYNLGAICYRLNDFDNAYIYIENSIRFIRTQTIKDSLRLAHSLIYKALILEKKLDFENAELFNQESIDILQKINNKNGFKNSKDLIDNINNLSVVYQRSQQKIKLINNLYRLLDIYKILKNKNKQLYSNEISTTLYDIGNCYLSIEKVQEAERLFKESLDIVEASQEKKFIEDDLKLVQAQNYFSLGIVYSELKNFKKSLDYDLKAIDAYKILFEKNYPVTLPYALSLCNLGSLYSSYKGYFKQAETYYCESITLLEKHMSLNNGQYVTFRNQISIALIDFYTKIQNQIHSTKKKKILQDKVEYLRNKIKN